MKVELIQKEEIKKEIKYPCLMQYKDEEDPFIVLFICDSSGVVIGSGKHYTNGLYSDYWNINAFYPYKGKVVLEND